MIAQRETVSGTDREDVEQGRRRHSGPLGDHHHLGERSDMLKEQCVVDELNDLTATDLAAAIHVGAHVAQDRLDTTEQIFGRPHHDAECTGIRCGPRARYRRIGKCNSAFRHSRMDGSRADDRRRAEVDDDHPGPGVSCKLGTDLGNLFATG
jgi:hypothetical protein